MGLIENFRTWRRNRAIKLLVREGASVPSESKLGNGRLLYWNRGDYTLKNSELLFAAVSRISNSLSSMPVALYRDTVPLKRERLNALVSFSPNPNMTSCTFFKTMEACRCSSGNAYAMKVYDESGGISSLDILDPTRVKPILEETSGELWYLIRPEKGPDFYVHNFHMVHIPFLSTNGLCGINPVSVLFDTMAYSEDIQRFNRKQLENGVKNVAVLEAPSQLGPEQRKAVIKDFMETYKETGGNILLLESGVKASSLNMSPVDSKLFEVEKITRSKVAMVYNLPPHLLGDYSDTSFHSQEQQMLEFMQLTMLPIVTAYEQELNRKLLTPVQRGNGWRFRFDMDAILRADSSTMAEVEFKEIRSGTRTPDEIRAYHFRPPLPGGIGKHAFLSQDLATVEYTVKDKPKVLMAALTNSGGAKPPDQPPKDDQEGSKE